MAEWLYGCMAVWLYGCMAVWLYGCMAVVRGKRARDTYRGSRITARGSLKPFTVYTLQRFFFIFFIILEL